VIRSAAAAVLALMLLAGCSGEPTAVATVSGRVELGPTCPVETEASPCPPAPAAGVTVELRDPDGVVAATTTGSDGSFQLSAPAGDFELIARSTEGLPSEDSEQVHLDAGDDLAIDLMLDTGIR